MPLQKTSRSLRFLILAALLLAGCAQLKQCAYQGVNRDDWQNPQKVLESLDLRPGTIVADLGAGGGYFTFRLAERVGADGRVYAVDIDRDMNDLIADRAKKDGASNVETVLARRDDAQLPATGVDLIFTVNTYHHIDNRVAYFSNLRKSLRPKGRIAIIDFDRRAWMESLFGHYTPAERIQGEMEQAGFILQRKFDFLDRQSFLLFVPGP